MTFEQAELIMSLLSDISSKLDDIIAWFSVVDSFQSSLVALCYVIAFSLIFLSVVYFLYRLIRVFW